VSTAQRRVLVTGAGGKTGRAVVHALAQRGAEVVALVRDAGREPPPGARALVADQREADALTAALTGVDAVVAIAPNLAGQDVAMAAALVAACRRAGTDRVVLHSVVHPQLTAMPHHTDKARAEEVVVTSGLAWTVLQPNAYLQNLAGYVAELRAGRYPVPHALDAASAMVDLEDVATVAARCAVDDLGVHATFELSGPAEVTPRDVARVAGEVLGRAVVAERVDLDDWLAARPGMADGVRGRLRAMLAHYDAHGSPGDATVLTALLGRDPGDLAAVLARLLA